MTRKVQLNMDIDMIGRIDAMAKRMGVSRSAFISFSAGQMLMTYEKSLGILDSVGEEAKQQLRASQDMPEL